MAFIKDLYHDEIRDGYLVKADMKKVWNRQLEIWQEVDRICRKHNITYWAAYGTLLGAVRHKGFIPWDDDIDVCMMRPDFNRFVTVLADEFKGSVFEYKKNYISLMNICHSQTTKIDFTYYEGRPQGISIGIFALDIFDDGTPKGFAAFNALLELFMARHDFSQCEQLQRDGVLFNDLSFLKIFSEIPDKEDQLKLFWLYAANIFDQSDALKLFIDVFSDSVTPMQKEWFRETIYLPFETIELPAPKMFDEVLTSYYGDWRTPVRDEQSRLGFIHSADIPWREFLEHVDLKKLLPKNFLEGLKN